MVEVYYCEDGPMCSMFMLDIFLLLCHLVAINVWLIPFGEWFSQIPFWRHLVMHGMLEMTIQGTIYAHSSPKTSLI